MRSEVNYNVFPDPDWTTWSTRPYDAWCFIDAHDTWEHPALSDLAQQTRVSYGALDLDPKSFIEEVLNRYWVQDIISRKDEVHEDLYYAVVEYQNIYDFVYYRHYSFVKWFAQEASKIFKNRSGTDQEQPDDKKHLESIALNSNDWMDRNFDTLVKRPYIDDIVARILRLMVEHNYAPNRKFVERRVLNNYKYSDNRNDNITYRLYLSDKTVLQEPMNPIDYKIRHNNQAYKMMIVMYPGENLSSYIHDQMAFMNFVQTTVEHDFDDEKDIVISRRLLDDNVDKQAFDLGISRFERYWT